MCICIKQLFLGLQREENGRSRGTNDGSGQVP
jgi:hypothetical protein